MTLPPGDNPGAGPDTNPPQLNDTFSKPDPKVAVSKETKHALVVVGALLVILAIVVAGLSWGLGSKTTETEPAKSDAVSQVEKTKKTYSGPSDNLLMAVLGSGAALILVGFLYGRISSIKLPGGVDIGLTAEEAQKAAKKTLESLPDDTDPATAAKAIQKTQDAVLAVKATQHAEAVAQVPDDQIGELAESAAEAVKV